MTTVTEKPQTEAEKRAAAKQAAAEIVANARQANAEYEERTGRASSISEADYAKAAADVEVSLLRIAGLKPIKGAEGER